MECDADIVVEGKPRRVAQVIEVRSDDDVFVAEHGIASLDDRADVVRIAFRRSEELVVRACATALLEAQVPERWFQLQPLISAREKDRGGVVACGATLATTKGRTGEERDVGEWAGCGH